MEALVIVEHNNKQLALSNRNTLRAAIELSATPVLLLLGHDCMAVAEEAATLAGVAKVLVMEAKELEHPLAENYSTLIAELAKAYKYILAPATTFGKNLLPRVAALLDVTQVSDVSSIISADTFEHPIYAGNAIETVKILDEIKVLTIRTTAFAPINESQTKCPIERLEIQVSKSASEFISHSLTASKRPELANAKIIVSGGRGLQSKEQFKLIEELADCLNAAVGATRAAVDAGFVPNDYQVGQTGKIVAPELYLAIGISGAIQHLAGMKDAKVIVAINKDGDAPIFQIADYGLVGDLFELIPQLIEQLRGSRC